MAKQFYDIYGFYYMPFWHRAWFWQYCAIIILSLILVITYLVKKYRSERLPRAAILLPWDWAIKEFSLLAPEEYESKEAYKTFYFHLTLVLKSYFHKRYGWALEDKTDDELLSYLRYKKFDQQVLQELASVLHGAGSVKFANMDALPLQAKNDLSIAKKIVLKTAPSSDITTK